MMRLVPQEHHVACFANCHFCYFANGLIVIFVQEILCYFLRNRYFLHTCNQGRIQPVRLGVRYQQYLVVKSHNGFATVREMKCTSQHCWDKTMDDKMALYRECCFPNYIKSWWIKLLS